MAHRRPLLLLILLALFVGCHKPDPRIAETRQELDSFAKTIREFRDHKGLWPANLIAAVGNSCIGDSQKCVSGDGKRIDPWGTVYEYDQSLRSALVRSAGPDKAFGTRDDLEADVRPTEPAKAEPPKAETPMPAAPAMPGDGGSAR